MTVTMDHGQLKQSTVQSRYEMEQDFYFVTLRAVQPCELPITH